MTRLFVYGIAAALILGGAWAAWSHYTGLVDEKASLSARLATSTKERDAAQQAALEQSLANVELRQDLDRRDEILSKNKRDQQALQTRLGESNAALDALNSRPEVAAWSAGRVPGAVVDVLRRRGAVDGAERGPQDGARGGPEKPPAADAGAAAARGDQRGPGALGAGPRLRAGQLQR